MHALVESAAEVKQQDAVIFMVSAFCGLRLGELLDLRWRAVNFEGICVPRGVELRAQRRGNPEVGRRARGADGPGGGENAERAGKGRPGEVGRRASCSPGEQGRHVDANDLRKRYYKALERAGLRRIRIHDLRHTFGTVCAAKGIPLTTIKEWMGHADLSTTEIYTAFYPQDADAARISEAFAA